MELTQTEYELTDGVALIRLNRPDQLNAFTPVMREELIHLFQEADRDDAVRAVVVTGAGRAFCAGADLDDLAACRDEETLRGIYSGFLRLASSPLPTVAAVNGAAVGAGLNMALACDVIVAGASARFDTRFLQIGLHPGGGNTWRLRRITDLQTTMALVVFGEVVDGARAAEVGLAWACVPDDELVAAARTMAARAAAGPPELVRRMKATVQATDGVTTSAQAVDLEVGPQLWSFGQPAFTELLDRLRSRMKDGR
jgi:enoyl-CoA hydratase